MVLVTRANPYPSVYLIWKRDDGVCWLCNGAVPEPGSVSGASPSAASRDHIISRANGGPMEWWNLRCAHRGCNSARGSVGDWREQQLEGWLKRRARRGLGPGVTDGDIFGVY